MSWFPDKSIALFIWFSLVYSNEHILSCSIWNSLRASHTVNHQPWTVLHCFIGSGSSRYIFSVELHLNWMSFAWDVKLKVSCILVCQMRQVHVLFYYFECKFNHAYLVHIFCHHNVIFIKKLQILIYKHLVLTETTKKMNFLLITGKCVGILMNTRQASRER